MYTSLKADFFAGNRKRLKKKLAEKLPIIIAGNGLLQRTSDNAYSFTQDSNFWYLTGIDIPDMVLVIDVHETFVIVPDRSVSREAFDGKIDALALETRSGITAVYNEADGWTKIKDAIKSRRNVSCMLPNPPYDKGIGMYVNPARKRAYDRLRRITGNTPISDCRPSLAELRAIKQPEEIEQINQRSIYATPLFAEFMDTKFNIIDTPGSDDYIGEAVSAFKVPRVIQFSIAPALLPARIPIFSCSSPPRISPSTIRFLTTPFAVT